MTLIYRRVKKYACLVLNVNAQRDLCLGLTLIRLMPYDVSRQTWELTTLQRGLVDNCFEEGQYETAIATLEQTRSSEFKPWPYVRTYPKT